ncbi:MEMO1 family protein, partial [Lecanoromycetidae sp. Uapishka_2]
MTVREASHAGSWYTDHGPTLKHQLEEWLSHVDESAEAVGQIPQPGARVIIAPHAGYSYSGPAAAWAYKSLDLSKALAMQNIESGRHDAFLGILQDTGNTVCGRHPIGVVMAAIETLKKENRIGEDKGMFHFVRYERSSEVIRGNDSSVSYASAFAVL